MVRQSASELRRPGRLLLVLVALAAALVVPGVALGAAPTDPSTPTAPDSPLRILRIPEALDRIGRPLQDVPVAVPDTGLDLTHPDLQPRLFALPQATAVPDADGEPDGTAAAGAAGWDFIGTGAPPPPLVPDADPSDVGGHGTLVTGLIGAAWNNGQGGAGVAPNARLMALRSCWVNDECYQYVQETAVAWAAARGVRVVSMSWLSGALEPGFEAAIRNASNTLFVAIPSGNGGATDAEPDAANRMPCNLDSPNVLCVTTSSPSDGLDCGDFGATLVDVAVPTQGAVTTTPGGGYTPTGCATSFAAPIAAGVATILFGLDPTAPPAAVKSAIVDSVRKVPAWSGRSVSGGIVDAEAAVALFAQRRGITLAGPPAPPAARPSSPAPTPVPISIPKVLAPEVTRPVVTVSRGRRASVRVSARVSANGAATTWAIQRRVVTRKRNGRRVVSFTTLKRGTLGAAAPDATVSVVLRPARPVVLRIQVRNRAGTVTSRLVTAPAV